MHRTLPIAALAVLATGTFLASTLPAKVPPLPDPSKPRAKAFVLTDQNGEKVFMSKFRGQIVVLEWVNFDCPVSQRHYTEGTFKTLLKKYEFGIPGQPDPQPAPARGRRGGRKGKKRPKVVWLAINSTYNSSPEANKKAAQQYGVPYPILDDHTGKVGRLYGATHTPHVFIKAPDGTIAYDGAVDNDPEGTTDPEERVNYVEKALEALLIGKEPETPKTKPYGCTIKYAKRR
jgi:peroxiredoxin